MLKKRKRRRAENTKKKRIDSNVVAVKVVKPPNLHSA